MDKEFELHTTPREILICVDSYDKGVLSGRLFFPGQKAETFSCLTQCLLRIDSLLNEDGQLQSFTEHRTFREPWLPERLSTSESGLPRGPWPPSTCRCSTAAIPAGRESWLGRSRSRPRASAVCWS